MLVHVLAIWSSVGCIVFQNVCVCLWPDHPGECCIHWSGWGEPCGIKCWVGFSGSLYVGDHSQTVRYRASGVLRSTSFLELVRRLFVWLTEFDHIISVWAHIKTNSIKSISYRFDTIIIVSALFGTIINSALKHCKCLEKLWGIYLCIIDAVYLNTVWHLLHFISKL